MAIIAQEQAKQYRVQRLNMESNSKSPKSKPKAKDWSFFFNDVMREMSGDESCFSVSIKLLPKGDGKILIKVVNPQNQKNTRRSQDLLSAELEDWKKKPGLYMIFGKYNNLPEVALYVGSSEAVQSRFGGNDIETSSHHFFQKFCERIPSENLGLVLNEMIFELKIIPTPPAWSAYFERVFLDHFDFEINDTHNVEPKLVHVEEIEMQNERVGCISNGDKQYLELKAAAQFFPEEMKKIRTCLSNDTPPEEYANCVSRLKRAVRDKLGRDTHFYPCRRGAGGLDDFISTACMIALHEKYNSGNSELVGELKKTEKIEIYSTSHGRPKTQEKIKDVGDFFQECSQNGVRIKKKKRRKSEEKRGT